MSKCLIGKTITAIFLSDDREYLKFELKDDAPIIACVEADCCSHTWIENVENPETILNSPVLSQENVDMPDGGKTITGFYEEEMQYYGYKIKTATGESLMDYRNSSNGYYGGRLEWPDGYGAYDSTKLDTDDKNWQKIA